MKAPVTEEAAAAAGERIAKRIARAGVASRRDAEAMIEQGRVSVDGKTIKSPALNVTDANVVAVDGQKLPAAERTRLWRYHKPAGLIVSNRDPEGRQTIFDTLPSGLPRVISVGRLDYNSEGLLLLTNDGALARKLELPSTGWTRRYRVRVHGSVPERALADMARGMTVDGVQYGPIKARLDRTQRSNAWLTLALEEGKNREIRKVMEYIGVPVSRLIRIGYGPFALGDLQPLDIAEVPAHSLEGAVDSEAGRERRASWAKAKPRKLPPHKKTAKNRRAVAPRGRA
jgi:23S rRNA pseudouridine2605 synthase